MKIDSEARRIYHEKKSILQPTDRDTQVGHGKDVISILRECHYCDSYILCYTWLEQSELGFQPRRRNVSQKMRSLVKWRALIPHSTVLCLRLTLFEKGFLS